MRIEKKNGVIVKTKRNIFVKFVLSFITLISGQIIFGTPVFAVTNPTLTINLGSLSSLDLMPGNFGSVSQSVGITTNNYTGYTVNLTNPTNLPNATVTLGGNGIDGGDDINSITIIEFEVIKNPAS